MADAERPGSRSAKTAKGKGTGVKSPKGKASTPKGVQSPQSQTRKSGETPRPKASPALTSDSPSKPRESTDESRTDSPKRTDSLKPASSPMREGSLPKVHGGSPLRSGQKVPLRRGPALKTSKSSPVSSEQGVSPAVKRSPRPGGPDLGHGVSSPKAGALGKLGATSKPAGSRAPRGVGKPRSPSPSPGRSPKPGASSKPGASPQPGSPARAGPSLIQELGKTSGDSSPKEKPENSRPKSDSEESKIQSSEPKDDSPESKPKSTKPRPKALNTSPKSPKTKARSPKPEDPHRPTISLKDPRFKYLWRALKAVRRSTPASRSGSPGGSKSSRRPRLSMVEAAARAAGFPTRRRLKTTAGRRRESSLSAKFSQVQ
ncbi:hypothetical protein V5799_000261 [Amblyomma americanum]|uniref:Uncharacterized protein n=1 Tax=Amblyomma americanum TaxID=6943 RepID=A0AAQ4D3J5_AMBAM